MYTSEFNIPPLSFQQHELLGKIFAKLRGHYINALLPGKSHKITIHLHCLTPKKIGTPPKTNMEPQKLVVSRCFSFSVWGYFQVPAVCFQGCN